VDVVLHDSKMAMAWMKMGNIEKMRNTEKDNDMEAGQQDADIPHRCQQQIIQADFDDPSNGEMQGDDSHLSSPAHC